MKILVVSNTPWDNANSFGISYSNIFNGIKDIEFANIYCSTGSPNNEFHMICYQITAKSLIRNVLNKNNPSGHVVQNKSFCGDVRTEREQKGFDKVRTLRWQIMFWGRDLIWKIGKWKSVELYNFLDEYRPDVIFQPIYYSSYLNDIAQFVKQYTGAPMLGYISDDNYTLRQFRLSPLYWIDRFWKRRKVKKTIELCNILYVISDIQKEEYEKIFNIECKILTKCSNFPEKIFDKDINYNEIKIVYGGNIGFGRWKSLKLLVCAVERLKQEGYKVRLDIYSGTPYTKTMTKALSRENCCYIHGAIKYDELIKLQESADILVHVEGLSLKSRCEVHQSFSTKLVDYFEMGKCIFAIGTNDEASIKHLLDNDAAIVAQNKCETYEKLRTLLQTPKLIKQYEEKAYKCGLQHHNKAEMQLQLTKDLKRVIKNENTSN